jgi:hypothetical protein
VWAKKQLAGRREEGGKGGRREGEGREKGGRREGEGREKGEGSPEFPYFFLPSLKYTRAT